LSPWNADLCWVRFSDGSFSDTIPPLWGEIMDKMFAEARGWRNVDPVYRVGGGGVRSGVEFFFVTY
jgi:hypothetical protein